MRNPSPGSALLIAIGVLILPNSSQAEKIHGRFTLGGFASTERFTESTFGSDKNDFATLSARSFLKIDEIGEGKWEFVSDLRDKHDFFDKLDREKLALTAKNDFQVRQLSMRRPSKNHFWSGQLGRFPIPEAGAVYVDGLQVGNHWSPAFRSGLFGGLNPKQDSLSYLQFNPKATIYGLNLTYEPQQRSWARNAFYTLAVVNQIYENHLDRNYLYHNTIFQWNEDSRVIALLYLDFVPRVFVQTYSANWQQGLIRSFSTDLRVLGVDVIEYSRRQGVLEVLPPSRYSEGGIDLIFRPNSSAKYILSSMHGAREIDGLTRSEVDLAVYSSRFFSSNLDAYLVLGSRKNFTSQDRLIRTGGGYFSRSWESSLDLEYAIQQNTSGVTTHPLIAEVSLSHYYSKQTFFTLSFNRSADENVTIMSTFFKVGYRFGTQETPPVRDGAPPRGKL